MSAAGPTSPLYSVCQWSTPRNDVWQDIQQVARTGARGLGLWEEKLEPGRDEEVRRALASQGLAATLCVPSVFSVLPTAADPPGAAQDPASRTSEICDSIRRLAEFEPAAVVVVSGVSGDPATPAGPVEVVAEALVRIADAAGDAGVVVGLEVVAQRRGAAVGTVAGALELLDSIGRDDLGIVFDMWHSWSEPGVHDLLREHASRIVGVQVNDVRDPERTWADRLLPGDGRSVAPGLLAALIAGGYEGWFDLEVFSDDGTFGTALPDSLWAMPHEDMLIRAKAAFDRAWSEALDLVRQG